MRRKEFSALSAFKKEKVTLFCHDYKRLSHKELKEIFENLPGGLEESLC